MRFEKPVSHQEYQSEYDLPSDLLQDLIHRNVSPLSVKTISLATAGSMVIREPGYGFVLYGFSTLDNSKYTEAFVRVGIDCEDTNSDPTRVFPCKSGRGYHGSFAKLSLSWPADPNAATNSALFVIFKSRQTPWQGGLEST